MRKSRKIIILVLVLCTFGIVIGGCSAVTEASSSPEKTVTEYLESIKSDDVDKALEKVHPDFRPQKDLIKKSIDQDHLIEFKVLSSEEDEPKAKVKTELTVGEREIKNEITFNLEKLDNEWKIILNQNK